MSQVISLVNVTNGSPTIQAAGVAEWVSVNGVTAGHLFTVVGSGVTYTIGSLVDNELTLTAPYAGVTENGAAGVI